MDVLRGNYTKTDLPECGISGCWNTLEWKLICDYYAQYSAQRAGFNKIVL